MSTIRVDTIKDINGANVSTVTDIHKGRAKAWINFNGNFDTTDYSGFFTLANTGIYSAHNVVSVTDDGIGLYTLTFADNTFNDGNYVFVGSVNNIAGNSPHTSGGASGPVGPARGTVGVFVRSKQNGFDGDDIPPTATTCKIEARRNSTQSRSGAVNDFINIYCVFFSDS